MRVLLLTGKGGVGKTSLSLATALRAAEHGHRVFVLSTDSAHSLGDALGHPVGPRPIEVAPGVTAQEVAALVELERSWGEIRDWLRAVLLREGDDLAFEELLVFPGLEELVGLRAVREVEASGEYDLCVVDCAPTGSTLRMLRLPDVLNLLMENFWDLKRRTARALRPVAERVGLGRFVAPEAVFEAFERLYDDVEGVRQILLDEQRTTARLVLQPARVVVDESRRAFAYLCLHGIATDAVLVNRLLPEGAREGYFARWAEREREQLQDIERSFPLPRFAAPLLESEPIGVDALRALGRRVYGDLDPAQRLAERPPLRLAKRGATTLLSIDMASVPSEDVEVVVRGSELWVGVRDCERRVTLPESVSGLAVSSAELVDGVLEVAFEPPAGAAFR